MCTPYDFPPASYLEIKLKNKHILLSKVADEENLASNQALVAGGGGFKIISQTKLNNFYLGQEFYKSCKQQRRYDCG